MGKSTLFNALLKRQVALAANYPFATIEPNIGVVDVPDKNLETLAQIVKKSFQTNENVPSVSAAPAIPEKIVPAVVTFYDIAGLVKGAAQGEGLGNKFLSHIHEVSVIIHVLRDFSDDNVIREGSTDPEADKQTINTELILADLKFLENRIEKHKVLLKKDKSKENLKKLELFEKLYEHLNLGQLASTLNLSKEDQRLVQEAHLLTLKPMIYVHNVDESRLKALPGRSNKNSEPIYLCAQIESELCSLSGDDQKLYMQELGILESGLDKVITEGFRLLGLQTYYTAGPKEVRAWTIPFGTKAPQAAGVIHTDFEKGFVKADVVSFDALVKAETFQAARDKGMIRLEGKDYVMQQGDVVEFKFNVT